MSAKLFSLDTLIEKSSSVKFVVKSLMMEGDLVGIILKNTKKLNQSSFCKKTKKWMKKKPCLNSNKNLRTRTKFMFSNNRGTIYRKR